MKNYDEKDDTDEDHVVRDGEVVRVPMIMMDGLQRSIVSQVVPITPLHRPGFALADNGYPSVPTQYEIYEKWLTSSWILVEPGKKADADTTALSLDARHDAYDQQLEQAWRGAA